MTSKEALERLRYEGYSKEVYDLIKKDLKVLEIIKEHKLLNYVLKNKKCANMYHLNESDINMLKEYINDNIRSN